jgi:hypothetical protein
VEVVLRWLSGREEREEVWVFSAQANQSTLIRYRISVQTLQHPIKAATQGDHSKLPSLLSAPQLSSRSIVRRLTAGVNTGDMLVARGLASQQRRRQRAAEHGGGDGRRRVGVVAVLRRGVGRSHGPGGGGGGHEPGRGLSGHSASGKREIGAALWQLVASQSLGTPRGACCEAAPLSLGSLSPPSCVFVYRRTRFCEPRQRASCACWRTWWCKRRCGEVR